MEKDENRAALNIEEAALLPAMNPKAMTGGAALRDIRAEENRMREMTVGEERAWNAPREAAPARMPRPVTNRAALHHVMRKK